MPRLPALELRQQKAPGENEVEMEVLIKRILVALDSSVYSQSALEAAAVIASLFDAELSGLFVEDINLLRVAQLPFVREVRYPSGEAVTIDEAWMERYWRTQALAAQQQLSDVAAERALRWSFKVARGHVTDRLLAAALEADLLALGRLGRSRSKRESLGTTARQAMDRARGSLLLMGSVIDLELPLLLIYDGRETSRRNLGIAAILAQQSGQLRVLVWTDNHDEALNLKREVVEQLAELELEISFRRLYPSEQHGLVDALKNAEVGLLILGDVVNQLQPDTLLALLEELDLPVLILR
jgi:nucleotide-binding universal stress UspA family protein